MRARLSRLLVVLAALAGVLWGAPVQAANRCLVCHSKLPDLRLRKPAEQFRDSVHADEQLGCAGCHGGNRDDPTVRAHSTGDFNRRPTHAQIPKLCGRCHSDAELVRRFNASLPIDQLALYETSGHGKAFAKGDKKVATCIACHGVHNILPVADPRSAVHPRNLAKTCAKCHADATLMKSYKLPSDQFALWQKSVHGKAIARGNLAAATCMNCHGSHGAAPPAVSSVARVCGRCHQSQLKAFRASPHARPFRRLGFPECEQCHGNHEVQPATVEHIGLGPDSICVKCHSEGQKAVETTKQLALMITEAKNQVASVKMAIAKAERAGMAVGPAKAKLEEAHTRQLKLRNELHRFDPKVLGDASRAVAEAAAAAQDAVDRVAKRQELHRRDYGLYTAVVFGYLILVFLKIRKLPLGPVTRQETLPPVQSGSTKEGSDA